MKLPFFGKRRISEIQSKDVIAWQNKLLLMKDEKGKPYSPVYLKTIHNQLSAIFNHAVYKGLRIQMEAIHNDLQRISTERFIDDELLDRVEQITTIMRSMLEESNQNKEGLNDP